MGSTEEDLLAAVWVDPEADAPRSVYADWLLSRGDPRGEFIALQLARAQRGDAEMSPRERELLDANKLRWLGPLAAQLDCADAVFERGFVARCRVRYAESDRVRVPVDCAEWATLCEVEGAIPATDNRLMPALRRVTGIGDEDIRRLRYLQQPLAIDEMVWESHVISDGERGSDGIRTTLDTARRTITGWAVARVLPRLRRLERRGQANWIAERVSPDRFAWVWRATPALEELATSADLRDLPAWLAELAETPLRRIELRDAPGSSWALGAWIAVERDDRAALSRLRAGAPPSPEAAEASPEEQLRANLLAWRIAEWFAEAIEELERDQLTEVDITLPHPRLPDIRARLHSALDRQTRLATAYRRVR